MRAWQPSRGAVRNRPESVAVGALEPGRREPADSPRHPDPRTIAGYRGALTCRSPGPHPRITRNPTAAGSGVLLVHRAAGLGHLNIVIYLVGLFHLSARHIYAEDGDIRAWALENDCLDIVIWLTSKFGTNNKYMRKHAVSWRHMLLMSCNNKDVDCTKWVLENMPLDTYTNHCFLTAVNVGSTEILDLLVLHGIKPEPFSWHVLEQNNLWNVAEWMVKKLSYEQRNVVFNNRTICFMHWDHIPDKFKKDWLKYTHTHRTDGVDMLNAIADGKIYFVHFLIFELHFPNIDVPIELDDDMLFSLSPTQLQKLQEINECIKN